MKPTIKNEIEKKINVKMDIKEGPISIQVNLSTRNQSYKASINLTKEIMKPNFESTIC